MGHSLVFFRILTLKLACIALLNPVTPGDASIKCVSPGYGSYVTITNPMTQKWWDTYKKNSGAKLAAKKEYISPEPVIFRWDDKEQSKSGYELIISTDPAFLDKQVYRTNKQYYRMYNLYGGKQYYWRVRCRGEGARPYSPVHMFFTRKCARTIKVKGAYNMQCH